MQIATGNMKMNSGTGTQPVTGVGFQPNLVLFWSSKVCNGAADCPADVWRTANVGHGFGAAAGLAGASTASQYFMSLDNGVGTPRTHANVESALFRQTQQTGFDVYSFVIDSFDADGFTIDTLTNATAERLFYVAILADNVDVRVQDFPTSTGAFSWAGVGFEPDLMICAGDGNGVTSPSHYDNPRQWFGAYDGTRQFAESYSQNTTVSTATRFDTDDCIAAIDAAGGTLRNVGNATGFQSGGIDLNADTVQGSVAKVCVISIKDADDAMSVFNDWDSAASTGNDSYSGLSHTPDAVILASVNSSSVDATVNDLIQTIGVTDGTHEGSCAVVSEDNDGVSDIYSYHDLDSMFQGGNVTGTSDRVMDFVSLDSGGLTGNWTTVNGSVRIGGIAFGGVQAAPAAVGVYTVGGSAANLLYDEILPADVGAYAIAGSAVNLYYGWHTELAAGAYTLAGTAADLLLIMPADVGAYTIAGSPALLAIDQGLFWAVGNGMDGIGGGGPFYKDPLA